MYMNGNDVISIGDLAKRTGISVSAIRFYEARGLVVPFRSSGGQRRFLRSDIRRLSFIRIAQKSGLSIDGIASELAKLPQARTPTALDWARIGAAMRDLLNDHIAELSRTRDLLNGCIGCGCLSLKNCALYNPKDRIADNGTGPRFVLGDLVPTVKGTKSPAHKFHPDSG
jgi:MerR family transcriptional regulator, redox-sensitive transcriptional activator SoxR